MHSVCRYAPNIDPTSNSAYPVEIMRILRLAEEAPPAIVATLHEAQKTVPDQSLRSKRAIRRKSIGAHSAIYKAVIAVKINGHSKWLFEI